MHSKLYVIAEKSVPINGTLFFRYKKKRKRKERRCNFLNAFERDSRGQIERWFDRRTQSARKT